MNRSVVVSGGGTGIGLAVARAFAEAGDDVVIVGRRVEVVQRAAAELGERVRPLVCDVADWAAVERISADIPAHIDVLVNGAGANMATRTPTPTSLAEISELWQAQYRANVLTTVTLTYSLLERIGTGGRIIGFSSGAARTGGAGSHGYGVAKAAVEAWGRALSAEIGRRGITVNVVAPGVTDGTDFFPVELAADHRQRLLARTDNGRAGTTAEVAAVVMFLASPLAGHLSGQTIAVDGGRHL